MAGQGEEGKIQGSLIRNILIEDKIPALVTQGTEGNIQRSSIWAFLTEDKIPAADGRVLHQGNMRQILAVRDQCDKYDRRDGPEPALVWRMSAVYYYHFCNCQG